MKRWLTLLLVASFIAENTLLPAAYAQEEDLDRLFEEDAFDDPAPPFGEPPPPAPIGNEFDNMPPGAGFPPPDTFTPPTAPPTNVGRGGGGGGPAGTPRVRMSGDVKERFSDANIEDITNANFPETIESFDFPNADIKDVIKAISELTGKNFIIESTISGRVTIMAPSKITVAEAYKAFLSSLAGLGYTVVPSGKFLKIKNARAAQRDSIETYSGNYSPNADLLITRIVQLRHTSAEEVNKRLRILPSKDGEMTPYEPTNSLIITDFGSNVDRMMKIITEIDKPGFEETLEVIPIKYAKARDMAEMLNQIINKEPGGASPGGFRAGVPRFRARGAPGSGAPEELSLVSPDERTNAIIVLGTKPGIDKVKQVVRKLDYRLDPSEAGGIFVYHVKNGEAEKIAAVLQGVSQGASPTSGATGGGAIAGGMPSATRPFTPPGERQAIFGGDVKITADKATNSLVIVASKQDYDVVRSLLGKIDIPRDQVYVEAIIMEMNTNKLRDWNPAIYTFKKGSGADSSGVGRGGFSRQGTLANILNPASDSGAILGFGSGENVTFKLGGQEVTVPSLVGFLNFIQTNTESNILSTPQILALDNEEASIEVGESIPIQETNTTGTGIQTAGTRFEKAPIKLEIQPFISPDSEAVRMKITQTVKQRRTEVTQAGTAPTFVERGLKSNIVVNSGDTAVLGGLVRDEDSIEESKVPVLGDIPVLGWLFKSSKRTRNKLNMIMFLTPKIIRNQEQSQQHLTNKANERIEWLKENFDGRDPYGKKVEALPRATAPDESGAIRRNRN